MIQDGIVLTISGMAFVFLFLLLLVWIIKLASLVAPIAGGKPEVVAAAPAAPEEREIALSLALSHHMKSKARRDQ